MILGGLVGALSPITKPGFTWLDGKNFAFLGEIFLNALKMLVVPLIMFSMTAGIARLGDVRKLGRLGGSTLALYLLTMGLAVITGLILVNLIQPGHGVAMSGAAEAQQRL